MIYCLCFAITGDYYPVDFEGTNVDDYVPRTIMPYRQLPSYLNSTGISNDYLFPY